MLRTYRSMEQMPDTQGEELEGALTPLVQGEFILPITPGQAAVDAGYLRGSGYPMSGGVSGNGPTASVSQVPLLFPNPGSNPAPSFPTPPFEMRGSTPPGYERNSRGSVPPSSGAGRSWNLGGAQSVAPSTRTAHPEPLNGRGLGEATPSGVSHSTSPGDLPRVIQVYPPPTRKFPLWIAVGGAFGAAVLGAWLLGGTSGETTETKADTSPSGLNAPIADRGVAQSAGVLIPKPQVPERPGGASDNRTRAESEAVQGAADDSPKTKALRPKSRQREPEETGSEAALGTPERPPVVKPPTETEPTAAAPAVERPKAESVVHGGAQEKPATAPKKPPRLPTSGIGGI